MNIFILLMILPLNLWAQDLIFLDEQQFKPHMLDHLHEGCPANANCSADYGKARQIWRSAIDKILANDKTQSAVTLEQVRKDIGMPFSVWAKPESLKDQSISSWESSCRRHNLETGEVYWGEILIQNLNQRDEADQPFIFNRLAIEIDGKPSLVRTLRDSLPSMMVNNQLYYIHGEAGVYYGLLINHKGELNIIEPLSVPQAAREVPCPDQLKAQLENWPSFSLLFERSYCRAIWDDTDKTWRTLAVGWSC